MSVMTYAEAGCLALRQEMERDPNVWALGEDLGPEGGTAGQYRGLQKLFGSADCRYADFRIDDHVGGDRLGADGHAPGGRVALRRFRAVRGR